MAAQYSTVQIVGRVIRAINFCNTQIMNVNEYYIIEAIFRHIRQEGYQFSNLSIAQLSEESNTSQASVSRFVKKMGFSSFLDFRNSFSTALGTQYYRRIQQMVTVYSKASPQQIQKEHFERIMHNLQETYEHIDMNQLMEAVSWFHQADSVLLVGDTMTKSMFFTLQLDLMFAGVPAYSFLNEEMEEIHAMRLGEHDVLVLAGTVSVFIPPEQRRILAECRKKGVKVILILQDLDEELENSYDMHISYGIAGGKQSGFHSLFYISRLLSDLMMLPEQTNS